MVSLQANLKRIKVAVILLIDSLKTIELIMRNHFSHAFQNFVEKMIIKYPARCPCTVWKV